MAAKRKPIVFRIFDDTGGEKAFVRRTAPSALAAVIAFAAERADLFGSLDALPSDYITRPDKPHGKAVRFRLEVGEDFFGIDAMRTCRRCGCAHDRPCEGGCSWVAADLCSACNPKPVKRRGR